MGASTAGRRDRYRHAHSRDRAAPHPGDAAPAAPGSARENPGPASESKGRPGNRQGLAEVGKYFKRRKEPKHGPDGPGQAGRSEGWEAAFLQPRLSVFRPRRGGTSSAAPAPRYGLGGKGWGSRPQSLRSEKVPRWRTAAAPGAGRTDRPGIPHSLGFHKRLHPV